MVGVYTFKRFVCLVALVSVEAVTAAQTADATSGSPSHVVVIPDVHGDRDAFIQSLWLGSLAVGESGIAFTQFNSTFYDTFTSSSSPQRLSSRTDVAMVQLGDLIDRGPFSVDCITIASVVSQVLGWQTTRLIGTHETMAMAG